MNTPISFSHYFFPQPPKRWDHETATRAIEIHHDLKLSANFIGILALLGAALSTYQLMEISFSAALLTPALGLLMITTIALGCLGLYLLILSKQHIRGLTREIRVMLFSQFLQNLKPIELVNEISEKGIRCGLPNRGNTCWLNAALKFIASTHSFDPMITRKNINRKYIPLQNHLIEMVNELRTLEKGVVDIKKYDALVEEIAKLDGIEEIGKQEDARALFQVLFNVFQWPPAHPSNDQAENLVRTCAYYKPVDSSNIKYGKINSSKMWQEITIPQGYEGALKLDQMIESPDRLEVTPDVAVTEGSQFDKNTRFIHLPNTLIFFVKRSIISEEELNSALDQEEDIQTHAKKAYNPIHMNEDETITFTEYCLIKDNDGNILGVKPKTRKTYKLTGTITHSGEDGQGHYVCQERALNGTLVQHNDSKVKVLEEGTPISSQGYLLRLDLVGTELIS